MKQILIGIVQVVAGAALLFISCQSGPITYRYSKVPVRNQKFFRLVFRVAGAVILLAGIWWLWSIWRPGHVRP